MEDVYISYIADTTFYLFSIGFIPGSSLVNIKSFTFDRLPMTQVTDCVGVTDFGSL